MLLPEAAHRPLVVLLDSLEVLVVYAVLRTGEIFRDHASGLPTLEDMPDL